MKKSLALLLALVLVFGMIAGCSPAATTPEDETPTPGVEATPEVGDENVSDLKIGMICIHDENSGYDLAHLEGMWAAMETLGISEDQITYKYNIPEDQLCYDAAADLADSGCDIVFSISFGHSSYMQQAAQEYPEVTFVSATGANAATSGLPNLHNMFPQTYQSRYVSGVVAGMKLEELMTAGSITEPKVGYVGAFPFEEVVGGYTAFLLGIQSIVPEATMEVQYTNSWFDKVGESEAAKALMAGGAVIIGQHADSDGAPTAVQAAFDAGTVAYSVGYNIDMRSVAPDVALTSSQNNWGALYTEMLTKAMAGEALPVDLSYGYEVGGVMISELGEACAEGTAEKVAEIEAAIADGSLQVYDTSKFTVGGETITSQFAFDLDGDYTADAESGEAIVDGAFQESFHRSAPYFGLRIDGITELNN